MRKITTSIFIFLCSTIIGFCQNYEYPHIHKNTVVDTFHGSYIVKDDYRDLEDPLNITTLRWIDEQNEFSKKILSKANNKSNSFNTIDQYAYVRGKRPTKKGKYYFYHGVYGVLSVPALYQASAPNQQPDLLIDPNYISRTDKIGIQNYEVSKDSKYLAYKYNRNGSDWSEIRVVSIATGVHTSDILTDVKYSNIAWKDDGFFYSKYERGTQFSPSTGEKVYYHKLKTDQEKDSLIFERNNPSISFHFKTTTSERFLLLTEVNNETDIINVYYIDYQSQQPVFRPLVRNFGDGLSILDEHQGKIIGLTLLNADNGAIVEIDPENPTKWKTIVPGFSDAVLLNAKVMDNKIIITYQSDNQPILFIYDFNGNELFSKAFPYGTSLSGFTGLPGDKELIYSYESYTIPSVAYIFNVDTYQSRVIKPTEVSYTYHDIIYEKTTFTAKDGTEVPMTLIYKEGIKREGNNPAILTAYGGFGIVKTPNFDPGIVYFVRRGGVYAIVSIRGGGEYGREWEDAGRWDNKQTSFDDFNEAAEHLISLRITNPSKLASTGASNGGLVVTAAAMKRPDLYKAVVPEVAPLDMIRFEKFTVGHYHTTKYGSISNENEFKQLLSYSPLHNIDYKTNYPAMLVMTSTDDDRVPPFHSYKFVAAMQNNPYQNNPILLRVENSAGHSGSNNLYGWVKETADKYAFIVEMLEED